MKKAADAVRSLAGPQRNAAQAATGYVLQHAGISSAVTGIRTMEQLEEMTAVPGLPLSPAEHHTLSASVPASYYDAHR